MIFRLSKLNSCRRTTKFYCSTTSTNSVQVPKKSLQQRLKEHLKALVNDYKEVFVDCGRYVKEHPLKSGLWFSIGAAFLTCQSLNPSENTFRARVIEKSNELIFIGKSARNPEAEEHLQNIESYYNENQILRLSFGLFSVILRNFKSSRCDSFKENCSYIQPSYAEIVRNHIIDFGFLNKWWIFDRKMLDFDINPNEWKENNKQ
ncbi:hypothetical protein V9T40_000367 [Parthenolecanium corni]|uniref:Uncharacterized protein n=1 Tax=Parthenolecanium corni TaxID=536013 RepID=A0AAN9TD74_9HEMI